MELTVSPKYVKPGKTKRKHKIVVQLNSIHEKIKIMKAKRNIVGKLLWMMI